MKHIDARVETPTSGAAADQLIHTMLTRISQETMAARVLRVALETLVLGLRAEGAFVLEGGEVTYQFGSGFSGPSGGNLVLSEEGSFASDPFAEPRNLSAPFHSSFTGPGALVVWRCSGATAWTPQDRRTAEAAAGLIRLILDHHAVQREMARQSRTDPLTGLLNRRAFHEDLPRHIERLERDQMTGSLILADIDGLRAVNEELGTAVGDQVLTRIARLLRDAFRPTDLVARLGADDFAIWLNGADQFTAAERADWLRSRAPRDMAEVICSTVPALSLSLGIAIRPFGSALEAEYLVRQAQLALREVKETTRGHWRVAQPAERTA